MFFSCNISWAVAVNKHTCIARNQITCNRHTFISVFTAAAAVDCTVWPAVCNKASVVKTYKAAYFSQVSCQYNARSIYLSYGIYNGAFVLHTYKTAYELVALIACKWKAAFNGAAVNNCTCKVIIGSWALCYSRYTAYIGCSFKCSMESNICKF